VHHCCCCFQQMSHPLLPLLRRLRYCGSAQPPRLCLGFRRSTEPYHWLGLGVQARVGAVGARGELGVQLGVVQVLLLLLLPTFALLPAAGACCDHVAAASVVSCDGVSTGVLLLGRRGPV
jgi:hypothetical protein